MTERPSSRIAACATPAEKEAALEARAAEARAAMLAHERAAAAAIRELDGWELRLGQAGYSVGRDTDNALVDAYDSPAEAWIAAAAVYRKCFTSDGRWQAVCDAFGEPFGDLYVDHEHTDWLWSATWPSVETAYAGDVTTEYLVVECARRVAAAIAVMAYGVRALEVKAGALPNSPVGA